MTHSWIDHRTRNTNQIDGKSNEKFKVYFVIINIFDFFFVFKAFFDVEFWRNFFYLLNFSSFNNNWENLCQALKKINLSKALD